MQMNKEVVLVRLSDIIPNRFQPRLTFDEEALNELANSIKEHGIIQPLILRNLGSKYEIIAGERRYKAATLAGLKEVPAIIGSMDDQTSAELALIENIQRKDLTAIEEAKSYKKILDMGNFTQEELAKRMGKSQSTVANKMRLLALTNEVQMALMNNLISERHARCLLQIKDEDKQKEVLNKVITERMNVRDTDNYIKNLLGIKVEKIEDAHTQPEVNTNINTNPISLEPSNANVQNNEGPIKIEEWNPIIPNNNASDKIETPLEVVKEGPSITESVVPPKENEVIDNPNVYAETESRDFVNIDSLNSNDVVMPANVMNDLEGPKIETPVLEKVDTQIPSAVNLNNYQNAPVTPEVNIPPVENVDNGMAKVKLATAIRLAKDTVDDIRTAGYNVKMEELDIGNEYQIVIKIEK